MRRWLVLTSVLCFACKPNSDAENHPPACDIEGLRATTTTLAQLPPSERGRAAWGGLKSACGDSLPEPFVAHYDAKQPREAERLQNPAKQNAELEPLIRKACSDWDTLRAVMEDAPGDQRAQGSFLACKAERYDILSGDLVTGFATTEVTWALHQWLLDHGIERELAKPITQAMLAHERDLAAPIHAPSGLELPSAVGSPLGEGVAVYVSPQEIRVAGESVVTLDGAGHATAEGLRSSPLAAALTKALEQASREGSDARFVVLLAADARIPFATMLDVLDELGTASAAANAGIALAVTSPAGDISLLYLKTPTQAEHYFPAMTVELTSDGQTLAQSAVDEQAVAIGRDDADAFLRFAQTVKKNFPKADTVIVSASPELPLQQVVGVLAAVRGSSCELDPCVLQYGLLSRTPAHEHQLAGKDEWGNLIDADPKEVYGVGGLGLSEKDESEDPSGGEVSSKVEAGEAEITGQLDRDIIRRIVKAHRNEVHTCHQQGLAKNPKLAGTVTVNFVIAGSGKVSAVVVQETTLDDASVGNCIAKAVKRWTFPKPTGGGNVTVTYPFELSVE